MSEPEGFCTFSLSALHAYQERSESLPQGSGTPLRLIAKKLLRFAWDFHTRLVLEPKPNKLSALEPRSFRLWAVELLS